MNRTLAIIVAVFCLASVAGAQQVAGVDYMNTGLTTAKDDADRMLRLFRLGATASAPLVMATDDRLFFAFGYDLLLRDVRLDHAIEVDGEQVEGDDATDRYRLEDELHLASATLLYFHTLTARWRLSARATVAYGGDYAALVARGIDPSASIGAAVQLTDTFRLSFGLAYVDALDPVYVAPYVGWVWEPTDWFAAKGAFPRGAAFTFSYFHLLEFDVFGRLEGGEFYVADNGLDIDHYTYAQVQAGAGIGFRIVEDLWLSVQAGGAPFLRFEPRDEGGDAIHDGDYAPTWFARVLIDLRSFPRTKNKPTTYEPAHPVDNPGPVHQ